MTKSVLFNAQTDIPSLAGKVILVTGGNTGLGKASALELARHGPAQVWLACRDAEKGRAAAAWIASDPDVIKNAQTEIRTLMLDLASFDSVRRAAKDFSTAASRLDILMCNAGIMATAPGVTHDGYEAQLGTNHLGHALLLRLLLPVLDLTAALPGADVRVVVLSSDLHARWPKLGPKQTTTTSKVGGDKAYQEMVHQRLRLDLARGTPAAAELGAFSCYFRSKLANVLWARRLAREHPHWTVVAVHPGVVATSIRERSTGAPWVLRAASRLAASLGMIRSAEAGARNQLWAAVAFRGEDGGDKTRGRLRSGEYYEPVGVAGRESDDARDDTLADAFWEWTEQELDAFLAS